MATGVSPIITDEETAYLTVAEYKNAPTSIDFDNLVVGGNANAQDAELGRVIVRASSFLNEYLNQDLVAQNYTETQRVRLTGQGFIALHPFYNPVISLSSFEYGTDPNNLATLTDCSVAWFEPQEIIIPLSQIATSYSSAGPLAFGYPASARAQVFTKYNYVAGYANTTLAAQATLGATSLTVVSGAGIQAGAVLRINDGANQESVTVASNYTYGSTTVPLTSALAFTHASGVAIGNLPSAIKQAAILVATAFIKMRGDNSLTLNITTTPNFNVPGSQRYGQEIGMALEMVSKYRRIR
jgi:hypothetical protein